VACSLCASRMSEMSEWHAACVLKEEANADCAAMSSACVYNEARALPFCAVRGDSAKRCLKKATMQ